MEFNLLANLGLKTKNTVGGVVETKAVLKSLKYIPLYVHTDVAKTICWLKLYAPSHFVAGA